MFPTYRTSSRARGLTLAELSIALCITGIIGAAVSSFTFATATAWRSQEAGGTAQQLANLTAVRLNERVHGARLFGAWTAGDVDKEVTPHAAVLLWMIDKNSDGQIQTSEILLIEHDPESGKLYGRSRLAPKIDETWSYAEFTAASGLDTMRFRANSHAVLSTVAGLEFNVTHGVNNGRPRLEYRIRTNVAGADERFSGAASIRAPSRAP